MKTILLGLDCGNPFLVKEWIDELPTLKRLINHGAFGILKSTIPAATVPAWNCIFSGKNPGKLGLYDFVIIPFYGKNGLQPASYLYPKTKYLWNILSDFNKKVQIINVPVTYPPTPVEGLMISGGLLTPFYSNAIFTYPEELRSEINRVADGYEILPFTDLTIKGKEQEYLEKLINNVSKQVRVVKHLMKTRDWDFLSYVFFVTDSAQHYFWHHYDKDHPWHDPKEASKWKDAIKKVYVAVDQGISDILEIAPKDTNVIIVSDHGSGPLLGYFMVNEWLRREGFLSSQGKPIKKGIRDSIFVSSKNYLLKNFPNFSEELVGILPKSFLKRFLVKEREKASYSDLITNINWPTTKAYGLGSDGSIYINLKGREPGGIVPKEEYEEVRSELIDKLLRLENPSTRTKMRVNVYRKEEVYQGEYLESSPDIVFVLDDYKYVQRADLGYDTLWEVPESSGGHSMEGLFIAYGPDICQNKKELGDLKLYDILPTILHMMNVPIPDDIDGKVLTEIFSKDSEILARPIHYNEYPETSRDALKKKIQKFKETHQKDR